MLSGEKIIVFGASDNGLAACKYLSRYNQVLFACDNNPNKWGTFLGDVQVVSPENIAKHRGAIVVIALVKRYYELFQQLRNMGVRGTWHYVEYNNLISGKCEHRLRRIPDCIPSIQIGFDEGRLRKMPSTNNKSKKRKVLIIANYFPPIGGSGVQRPLKFVKYLNNFGYEPIVVTKGNCEKSLSMDCSLLDEIKGTKIIRIQSGPEYPEEVTFDQFKILNDLFGFLGMNNAWIEEYYKHLNKYWEFLPDNDVVWALYTISNIANIVDLSDISLAYTTIGPYSTALIGVFLKMRYGIKWVLDYRDPWTLDDYNMQTFYSFRMNRRDFENKLEANVLKMTDCVIGASEVYCKEFKELCPEVNVRCITNGYDESDFSGSQTSGNNCYAECFNIVYTGYLYPSYDVDSVLRIINELIADNQIDKKNIRLTFYGSDPRVNCFSVNTDINNIVRYGGYIQHDESISKLYGADVLLLFGSLGKKTYSGYNGKVFEYIRVGKPILCISSPGGVQNELLEKYGNCCIADLQNKEIIKSYIINTYNKWKKGNMLCKKEPSDFVKSFSREYLTHRLARVFDEIIDS